MPPPTPSESKLNDFLKPSWINSLCGFILPLDMAHLVKVSLGQSLSDNRLQVRVYVCGHARLFTAHAN